MPSRRHHRANPIDVIEAAYELQHDDRSWLRVVASAVRPLIEGGYGVWAYYFDTRRPAANWLRGAVLIDARRRELEAAKRMSLATEDRLVETMHVKIEPLQSSLEAARAAGIGDARQHAHYGAFLKKIGAADYLAFRTVETGGQGIAIAAAQRTAWYPDTRTRRLWARVAAHVAAARRLRAALAADRAPVDAVLTPAGRLEHAETRLAESAREALRGAVLDQERARTKLRRRDPVGATESWQALVGGQWSLIDRFERGGRRYLVAHRNPPVLADVRALSPRECAVVHLAALGKPNKLIAYELGVSESGVSSHLQTAMRKLGIASRLELIRLAALLGGPAKK